MTLDQLVADGPAVIVFYRCGWCPYCNLALRTYQRELLPELVGSGPRLLAIPSHPISRSRLPRRQGSISRCFRIQAAIWPSALAFRSNRAKTSWKTQRKLGIDWDR